MYVNLIYLGNCISMLVTMMHDFYDALAYLAIYASAAPTERQQILKRVGLVRKNSKNSRTIPRSITNTSSIWLRQNGSAFWGRQQKPWNCTIELLPELKLTNIGMKKLLPANSLLSFTSHWEEKKLREST